MTLAKRNRNTCLVRTYLPLFDENDLDMACQVIGLILAKKSCRISMCNPSVSSFGLLLVCFAYRYV